LNLESSMFSNGRTDKIVSLRDFWITNVPISIRRYEPKSGIHSRFEVYWTA
jgi:hypothetical protein